MILVKSSQMAAVLALFYLVFSAPPLAYAGDMPLKPTDSFEGGQRFRIGRYDLVQLNGDYKAMGRQYGMLLKGELKKFYALAVEKRLIQQGGLDYQEIQDISRTIFDTYPKRFKEILYGMAETSGIALEKLIILDQLLAVAYVNATFGLSCSSIAVWGDYTSEGPLVVGRNFDFSEYFRDFSEYILITVINPSDSSVPTATIGYVGQLGVSTALNNAGIFLANNEAAVSGGNIFYANRIHTFIAELGFLLDAGNLDNLDDAINSTRSNCSLIVTAADKERAYSYEWPPHDVKRRSFDYPGLLVSTNHFVDTSWGVAEPLHDTSDFSVRRRKNLMALGESYKGEFNAKKMTEILDVPLKKGGVTDPKSTIYQVVTVPAELKIWLKVPGFQDWTEIDLKKYF